MFMTDGIGTAQKQVLEVKSWRGLMILEHFLVNDDGTETNLLENCESWRKRELKVLRGQHGNDNKCRA
jgi:hypothetical protein